jgi:hypothetical protein
MLGIRLACNAFFDSCWSHDLFYGHKHEAVDAGEPSGEHPGLLPIATDFPDLKGKCHTEWPRRSAFPSKPAVTFGFLLTNR